MLLKVYNMLLRSYGTQDWWPVTWKTRSHATGRFEIAVGAILTQNTSWKNVEKALKNLENAGTTTPEKIASMKTSRLEKLIKPSGFYKQKATRLKDFCRFVLSFPSLEKFFKNVTREQLLGVKGIGQETADSLLLYACGKPHFVVDAYTKRIFQRLIPFDGDISYSSWQHFFESQLPKNTDLYNEFHALIVEHAKRSCRKEPVCDECVISRLCAHNLRGMNDL